MSKVLISRPARLRLKSIARYTRKTWGDEQREKYMSALYERFDDLAQAPHKGRLCDGLHVRLRRYQEGGHVIFYALNDQESGIVIVDVLHKSMDPSLHLTPKA